jgi:hypothetical protein
MAETGQPYQVLYGLQPNIEPCGELVRIADGAVVVLFTHPDRANSFCRESTKSYAGCLTSPIGLDELADLLRRHEESGATHVAIDPCDESAGSDNERTITIQNFVAAIQPG